MMTFDLAPFRRRWPLLGLAALLVLALAALLLGPGGVLSQNGPSVTGVAVSSSPASGGTYIIGNIIRVTLTFSEEVNVTGSPRLKIDMDPAEWGEKWAGYEGGGGSASLTFTHAVVEPNYSIPGIAVLADSLELNGGAIKSASSDTGADLSHTGLGHDPNHRVNWRLSSAEVPWVVEGAVSSSPASGDTYGLDETIRVRLTFNRAVNVTGTPRLKIDMDPAEWGEKWAGYESGGGTTNLTFAHTVMEPNYSAQGIAVLANTLELNGGAIRSGSAATDADLSHRGLPHDSAHKVDWEQSSSEQAEQPTPTPTPEPTPTPTPEPTPTPTPEPTPTVSSVAITSDAGGDDTYALDETITITVTFSEAVNVTGSPRLKIDMDPANWGEKWANYQRGSGADVLTFAHTVVEPNYSSQGISVIGNSLELNGGTIVSVAGGVAAELSHDGLGHNISHKIDWQVTPPAATPAPTPESCERAAPAEMEVYGIEHGVVVHWDAPTGEDACEVQGYTISVVEKGSSTSTAQSFNADSDATSYTITGLEAGLYTVTITPQYGSDLDLQLSSESFGAVVMRRLNDGPSQVSDNLNGDNGLNDNDGPGISSEVNVPDDCSVTLTLKSHSPYEVWGTWTNASNGEFGCEAGGVYIDWKKASDTEWRSSFRVSNKEEKFNETGFIYGQLDAVEYEFRVRTVDARGAGKATIDDSWILTSAIFRMTPKGKFSKRLDIIASDLVPSRWDEDGDVVRLQRVPTMDVAIGWPIPDGVSTTTDYKIKYCDQSKYYGPCVELDVTANYFSADGSVDTWRGYILEGLDKSKSYWIWAGIELEGGYVKWCVKDIRRRPLPRSVQLSRLRTSDRHRQPSSTLAHSAF